MPQSLSATPSSHIYSQPLALDPLVYGFYLADGEVLMLTQGQKKKKESSP